MKTFIKSTAAGLTAILLLALASSAFAADKKEKTVTITGTGECAKCSLKEADKCQTVVEVEKNGKTTKYYLTQNDVTKDFHENVCKETKKVTATGTVKKVDGKMEMTATKIEVVK